MSTVRRGPWVCVFVLLLATSSARSQSADPHFEQGLQALQLGDAQAAVDAFTRSLQASPKPLAWLNLGVAHVRLGRPHTAIEAFERFLATADPVVDSRHIPAVRAEIQRLRASSTILNLKVEPQPTVIQLDGREIATRDDGQLVLQPGPHQLQLWAPGHAQHMQQINLPAGNFQFALTLAPAPAGQPAPGARPEPAEAVVSEPAEAVVSEPAEAVVSEPAAPRAIPPSAGPQSVPSDAGPCWLGQTCIGLHATAGVPNAVGVGVSARIGRHLAFTADGQRLPTVTIEGADVHTELWSAAVRLHPFGTGFFVSSGFGVQRIHARVERSVALVRGNLEIPVMLLGAGYTSGAGLTLGIDVSLMVELRDVNLQPAPNEDPLEAELQAQLEQEANDAVDAVRDLLPFLFQLNLIRIGYSF